jgi:triphosphoribosyl-dephospho-CoA synthetase
MRFLKSDLPIVQQALNLYVTTLKSSLGQLGAIQTPVDTAELYDAVENAERLLARATAELRANSSQPAATVPGSSPTPGVTL